MANPDSDVQSAMSAATDSLIGRQLDSENFLPRVIVGLVIGCVATIGAFTVALAKYFNSVDQIKAATWYSIGPMDFLVSSERPPVGLIVIAVLGITAVAAFALTFEGIANLLADRPRRDVVARARGSFLHEPYAGRIKVTVIIPAHNEEVSLPLTLASLENQTRRADRVIVLADNCSDRTTAIAEEHGYEYFETVDNVHKKGGALNQILAQLLPRMGPGDAILVMDADTSIGEQFLEKALERLVDEPSIAAIGGIFYGEHGHGLLGQFQRNEYARYSAQIHRRRGRVFVLTGTASLFRAEALLDVAGARGVYIPGESGKVYDIAALTEDNELTLALKSLGATLESPDECTVTTELMPTWKALWIQRQRWQRGALENLNAYGLTTATARYWGQQVGIGYGTLALNSALILMLITALSVDMWIWFPFWLVLTGVFWIERVVTAWSGGWRARLLAMALIPELIYDVFLQAVFISCLVDISIGRSKRWVHVTRSTEAKT